MPPVQNVCYAIAKSETSCKYRPAYIVLLGGEGCTQGLSSMCPYADWGHCPFGRTDKSTLVTYFGALGWVKLFCRGKTSADTNVNTRQNRCRTSVPVCRGER
jgi:hypothetical protein